MVELNLVCPQERVELLAEALEALDALSVSVEDADALTDAEQPLFGEPGMVPAHIGWNHSRVKALYAERALAEDAATLLSAQDFFADCRLLGIAAVQDQDWVRLTQQQFEPVAITPDFWIVPTWHQPPEAARTVIRLDPGMAFGTGTHPTTAMCLRWIAEHAGAATPPGQKLGRVLDYGCGSGILAIAAAKYGATAVDALDIDTAAVEASRLNAEANGVVLRCGLPEDAQGRYDVVLANILATPLKVLAPLLCSRMADGGHLVLAGILERQADELRQAYAPWIALQVHNTRDGWVLMTGQR